MKKQVNVFLIIIIIIGVLMIAGMSVLYQERLTVLNSDYFSVSDNYEVCSLNLAETEQRLAQTEQQLQQNIQDVDRTVSLFEDQQQEVAAREAIISDRDRTITQLRTQVGTLERQVSDLQGTLFERNERITLLLATISNLEDEIDRLEGQNGS